MRTMAPPSEKERARALTLYEEGKYNDSYAECTRILGAGQDQQILVLAATNLYHLGRFNEAALHFRDLLRTLPASSHLHGYLGRCLQAQGDEGAAAEYAAAVLLDPTNADALRSYAVLLLSRGDDARAVPVLERLVSIGRNEMDAKCLIGAMIRCGRAAEAVKAVHSLPVSLERSPEYIDALFEAGDFALSAQKALTLYREQGGAEPFRKYVRALSRIDPSAATAAYRECPIADDTIRFDQIKFLQEQSKFGEALSLCEELEAQSGSTLTTFTRCRLLEVLGRKEAALKAYSGAVRTAVSQDIVSPPLPDILELYRTFLLTNYPASVAVTTFRETVGETSNPGCLVAIGELYEGLGDSAEARAWFYRAYRSDFLQGGLRYFSHLARAGDHRDAEKVLLYIIRNVRKLADLERVARVATGEAAGMRKMPRAHRALVAGLVRRAGDLSDAGLSAASMLLLTGAEMAIETGDFLQAKEYALRALDILPHGSGNSGRLVDLLFLSKDHSLIDAPVFGKGTDQVLPDRERESGEVVLALDPQEKKIVEFLREHRRVSELDLRMLLGTRRVAGVMNRLIRKAGTEGIILVVKRGTGEHGEEYEYTGN